MKATFRGAEIRTYDGRYDEKSKSVHTKIKFKADLSEPLRELMEWERIPDSFDEVKLHGSLVARGMALVPADADLKRHAIELNIKGVEDFKYTALRDKEGDIVESSITFYITTTDVGACGKVEQFVSLVGRAPSALEVTYDVQQKLDLGGDNDSDGEGEAESEESGDAPAEQQPEEASDKSPVPIDNALNLVGSNRKKKRRTRAEMTFEGGVDGSPTEEERARMDQIIDSNFAEVGEETAQEI